MNLIVHADDLGETREISLGILNCIEMGVVTSTSILANMPATDFAISEAKKCGRGVSFGVHLNLCEGYPLTNPVTLTQSNGTFIGKRMIALKAITGRLNLKEVENELSAQVDRICEADISISHMDSHKHLHQLPGVSKVVAQLAKKNNIERIRCAIEKGIWPKGFSKSARISRLIRSYFAKQAGRHFKEAGLRYPDRVFDLNEIITMNDYKKRLGFLGRLNGLTEMFCHPGTEQADVEKPGSCERHNELQFLLSDEFRSLIEETKIKLSTFWDC